MHFDFAHGVTILLHPLFGWKKVVEKRYVKTDGSKCVGENRRVKMGGWKWTGEFEGVICCNNISSLTTYYTQKCCHTVLIYVNLINNSQKVSLAIVFDPSSRELICNSSFYICVCVRVCVGKRECVCVAHSETQQKNLSHNQEIGNHWRCGKSSVRQYYFLLCSWCFFVPWCS